MSLAILFHFLCAQHVSDINISIIRSLRLFCWITTLVILFLVRCVLQFRCGWFGVVSVLQVEACNTDAIILNTIHFCFWIVADLSEGVQTSFVLQGIFIPCVIQPFLFCIIFVFNWETSLENI